MRFLSLYNVFRRRFFDAFHLVPLSIDALLPQAHVRIAAAHSQNMPCFGGPAQSPHWTVKCVKWCSLPFLIESALRPNQDCAVLGARSNHVHIGNNGGSPGYVSDPIAVTNTLRHRTRWIFHPLACFRLFYPKSNAVIASSRHQTRGCGCVGFVGIRAHRCPAHRIHTQRVVYDVICRPAVVWLVCQNTNATIGTCSCNSETVFVRAKGYRID